MPHYANWAREIGAMRLAEEFEKGPEGTRTPLQRIFGFAYRLQASIADPTYINTAAKKELTQRLEELVNEEPETARLVMEEFDQTTDEFVTYREAADAIRSMLARKACQDTLAQINNAK